MLYPKSKESELSPELFQSPSCEYRGAPFWAWNGRLSQEELKEQILIFKKMGMGGFHMHVRTGMDTPYLGREFMELIKFCVQTAEREQLRAWLYDEDRWPSGTAGGQVTAGKPENARKTLLLTTRPYTPDRPHRNERPEPGRGQESVRQDNGVLLARYDIVLDPAGRLLSGRRLSPEDDARGTVWYAYQEHATADPWFNDQAYVDTLNPQAIREFLSSTHEKYRETVGDYFGGVIPAIFTDEPQFAPKDTLRFAAEEKDVFLSWTTELPKLYRERYREELLDHVPELLWELPEGRLSKTRWQFQNLVSDLFVSSYCRQIGDWCRKNGLLLSGHVMGEPTLESQTQAVGDAMRCYPEFGLPGIDMLCDFHEYTTAKQAQSMVRQNGAEGMLSELYGVTGWDYDFRGYKLQGDWQAALGVTLRVPHLSWMTMKGEAKRDYPASIHYQSPWWEQFSVIEEHFARINTALTRGKGLVSVGVLHPIETYWLCWGPADQTAGTRGLMERQFAELAELLLFGGIDFDYLCEAALPRQCPAGGFPLAVGEMAYQTILIPPVRTLRSSTLQRLEAFQRQGGRLLFLGECPDHIDACPSEEARPLYERSERLPFDSQAILTALESERFLEIRKESGERCDTLLSQLRQEGEKKWLFLCCGKNPVSPDVDPAPRLQFRLRGEYALELFDTLSGKISRLPARYERGSTVFSRIWHMHDSLLLRLSPGRFSEAVPQETNLGAADVLLEPVKIVLEEPNLLLLDLAEFSINGGEFYSEEEVLRIDNGAREKLGLPPRIKEIVQPYLLSPETPTDFLTLRFRFMSELALEGALLGLEEPEHAAITLNGQPVSPQPVGWYVDKCIETLPLPPLVYGENLLEVRVPIGKRTNLEAFYLLGDFGVSVQGCRKTLTAPVRELGWGDIVSQGLPFYTGNLLYRFRIVSAENSFTLRVPQYRGGLIRVLVDGRDAGYIAFSPYALKIEAQPGEHTVELRLYGTRQNGFGQLHHTQGIYFYQSPNSWRSAGDQWSYEYRFKPMGILKSPELYNAFFLDKQGRRRMTPGQQRHMEDRS